MISKGLYEAPTGRDTQDDDLENPESDGAGIEIAIENPDDVQIGIDGVTIDLMPEAPVGEFDDNLVELIEDSELDSVIMSVDEAIAADLLSRKEWADAYVSGLDVLGLKYEERTEPWENACGAYSTLLSEAAIRFQAESIMESFPASGPVKTQIIGEETPEKNQAAERVEVDMNYQLTDVMTEYRPEHERMLYSLGLAGSAFKKVYFDSALDRQTSLFVPAEDVIVPFAASNLDSAERVTHVMRKSKYELDRLQASGMYVDVDLGDPQSMPTDVEKKKAELQGYELNDDNRYTLYECHTYLTLDIDGGEEDGAKPYVVTYDANSRTALSIRRNWVDGDRLFAKRPHFVHYAYIPGFGFYGMGLIHIIGGYARAGTSLLRQLVDAGTLSNLPGGLKSRGLRVKGDDTPIAPGEFRDVDVPSGTIRDNIMALPYKEPSQTLLTLLDHITEEGRKLGAISDMNISDMSAQAPVGTTLAI